MLRFWRLLTKHGKKLPKKTVSRRLFLKHLCSYSFIHSLLALLYLHDFRVSKTIVSWFNLSIFTCFHIFSPLWLSLVLSLHPYLHIFCKNKWLKISLLDKKQFTLALSYTCTKDFPTIWLPLISTHAESALNYLGVGTGEWRVILPHCLQI